MAHLPLPVDLTGRILDDVPCSACDKSLKGENFAGCCPNCGSVIALSLVGWAVAHVDSQGRIDEPLTCTTCGSALSGVEATGVCPRCRSPVGPTLETNLLRYANPRWVKGVSDGLMLYFIAMVLNLLLTLGNMVFASIMKNDHAHGAAGLRRRLRRICQLTH